MQQTDDLAAWLTQIWDKQEAAAKAATPGPWRHNPNKHWRKPGTAWFEEAVFAGPAGKDAECVAGTGETDDPQSMADARHIAYHDPASVLARIAADRQTLLVHGVAWNAEVCTICHHYPDGEKPEPVTWPCLTVRLLALPHAARPGYREEWKP